MKKISTGDQNLEAIQANAEAAIDEVNIIPILNGKHVKAVIASSDTIIKHRLGRTPNGWMIVSKDGFADIKVSDTPNSSPTTQLILKSDGATLNVTIYIY